MTRLHHRITTGFDKPTTHSPWGGEHVTKELRPPVPLVSLRCRFLVVNGRAGRVSLGRRLDAPGSAASWPAGQCVWDRQGQGGNSQGSSPIFYFRQGEGEQRRQVCRRGAWGGIAAAGSHRMSPKPWPLCRVWVQTNCCNCWGPALDQAAASSQQHHHPASGNNTESSSQAMHQALSRIHGSPIPT
jgi:hypothetical protein